MAAEANFADDVAVIEGQGRVQQPRHGIGPVEVKIQSSRAVQVVADVGHLVLELECDPDHIRQRFTGHRPKAHRTDADRFRRVRWKRWRQRG